MKGHATDYQRVENSPRFTVGGVRNHQDSPRGSIGSQRASGPRGVRLLSTALLFLAACATETRGYVPLASPTASGPTCTASLRLRAVGFRHLGTTIAAHLGEPRHRGDDLVVSSIAAEQVITGTIAYGAIDKAAEHEDVEVYACGHGTWRRLGATRSDGEGRFALALTGATRLPAGLHELVLSVPGDRTTATSTAYVAAPRAGVVVSDVDGTLTSSENAIVGEVLWHAKVRARPDAARVLDGLAARGYQPIYLTARPRAYTELTRQWLASHGFPRGPVILQPGLTLPGSAALAAKTRALARLRAAGLQIAVGIGNRASDVSAYTAAGLGADRIWIEHTRANAQEIEPLVARHRATPFVSYAQLWRLLVARLPG